jgi:hypothetical protein
MQPEDSSSPTENQALLQRERELKLEVAAARLQAAKAEYRLAMLKSIVADPSLAGVLVELFARNTGEELLPELVQEHAHVETN